MLAARAAETLQRVAGHVVAARDRDLLDRVRHIVDRDAHEPLRHRLARPFPPAPPISSHSASEAAAIDRLVAIRPEHVREMLGPDLAEHDVAIGDGERPAAPVAGRPRHRPRAFRPDPEALPVIGADRAAARRNGMDFQHRRPHPDARHRPLAGPLVDAGEMRNVGRGPAHVEADDLIETRLRSGLRHADDPARRPGEDRVLPPESGGVGEPAIGLHEEEAALPLKPRHDLLDIESKHRRQISVDHRGIAASDQLDQRLDLVARRNLGEADLPRHRRQRRFMRRPAPAVHQHDGERAIALVERGLQSDCAPPLHRAGAAPRPRRSPARQPRRHGRRAARAARSRARKCRAATGSRSASASPSPAVIASATFSPLRSSKALVATVVPIFTAPIAPPPASREDRLDPRHRRVLVTLGIVREQFADDQRAFRRAGDDVGEGAAPVDREGPGIGVHWPGLAKPA